MPALVVAGGRESVGAPGERLVARQGSLVKRLKSQVRAA